MRLNLKKIWFVVYMFLAIFEPPILPIGFIYVLGVLTVGLLIMKYGTRIPLNKPKKAGIHIITKVFLIGTMYIVIVGAFNALFIEQADVMSNRIRCINQLFVLSVIEFMAIWYIFQLADELHYGLKDVFRSMFISGALQGFCALSAYIIPSVRSFFIRYGDSSLFGNAYFFERRGFGFSMTLIDTFGYGMGLLAGYLILSKWDKNKVPKVIALVLMIFAIVVNARTGLIILAISIILKVLQGENTAIQLGKIILAIPIAYLGIFKLAPKILEFGMASANITIKWVATDMQELYMTLLYGRAIGASLSDASFFSSFDNIPKNVIEFIFGSGHSIYDTHSQLGFRTDVGYINLWWEFGLLGMGILLLVIFIWMAKPLKYIKDKCIRSMLMLNILSYFIVLFKAILIGYNPGVFVNYLCTFAIYYYEFGREDIVDVKA